MPDTQTLSVPAFDLTRQFAPLKSQVMAKIEQVLDPQACVNGPDIAELETRLAQYTRCPAAVAVSSGTDALLVALQALDISCGHSVVTSPFTFFATAGSLYRQGVTIRFADIDPDTFNLDPAATAAAMDQSTRAIMPVHLFGQMAEMEAFESLAADHDLKLIEDAAQAIGARRHDRPAGSVGDAAAFSFYPTKNLGAAGDAGMVTTRHPHLAPLMKSIRNHGMEQRYLHEQVGGNFRLDTIQAAVLLVKLDHLERWHDLRRQHAAYYTNRFASLDQVTPPVVAPGNQSVFNQYVIRLPTQDQRDGLRQHLAEHGIGTAVYYPLCLHQQPCFASLGYKTGDFPHAEHAAATVLALPVFPELRENERQHVADQIESYFD